MKIKLSLLASLVCVSLMFGACSDDEKSTVSTDEKEQVVDSIKDTTDTTDVVPTDSTKDTTVVVDPVDDNVVKSTTTSNRLVINGKEIFVSGTNVPWNNFANDFADQSIDKNYFTEAIIKIRAAGGNALRVWIYTDCSYAPKFGSDGLVSEMGSKTAANVKTLLDIAEEYGVVVDLCLLSFDMMQDMGKSTWSKNFSLENNKNLLTTDDGIQAFIDNAVTPLVSAEGVKGHPAIMCWEVFNEPEGMCKETNGWTKSKGDVVSIVDVQKVVNRVAAAVKKADPSVLVSNGSVNPIYSSEKNKNYYSDANLVEVGGEETGTLDFYMMHYYAYWQNASQSPFAQTAAYWGNDKPIIVGEFPLHGVFTADYQMSPADFDDMTTTECYAYNYDNGYAGIMSWTYPTWSTDQGIDTVLTFEEASDAVKALYNAHEDEIKIKDYAASTESGNTMMVSFEDLTSETGNWIFVGKEADFSGATKISGDFKLDESVTASGSVKVSFVLQTGSSWAWCQSTEFLTVSNEWQNFEIDLSNILAWDDDTYAADPSTLKKVVLVFYGEEADFSGAVRVDNVKIGDNVVSDFNDGYGLWSVNGDTDGSVTDIVSVFDEASK